MLNTLNRLAVSAGVMSTNENIATVGSAGRFAFEAAAKDGAISYFKNLSQVL